MTDQFSVDRKSVAPIFEIRMVCSAILEVNKHLLISGTVLATQAIANVVKTSFGPSGLDKMMVDDIGVRQPHRKRPSLAR